MFKNVALGLKDAEEPQCKEQPRRVKSINPFFFPSRVLESLRLASVSVSTITISYKPYSAGDIFILTISLPCHITLTFYHLAGLYVPTFFSPFSSSFERELPS